eukprot:gene15908-21581_t
MNINISDIFSVVLGLLSSFVIICKSYYHDADFSYFKEQIPIAEMSMKNEMNTAHSAELRHMIANLAHDLKTPLTSFMTTLDLLSGYIQEFKSCQENNPLFLALEDSVESLNVNYFIVLMVINRCIDYVKAAKQVKLIPCFESFTVNKVMEIPLSYVKHILEEDQLTLPKSKPELFCDIRSDKQWIYENLLCLLLNSTKFCSNRVNISVDVAVVGMSDIRHYHSCQDGLFFGYDDYPALDDSQDDLEFTSSTYEEIRTPSSVNFDGSRSVRDAAGLRRFNSVAPENSSKDEMHFLNSGNKHLTILKDEPAIIKQKIDVKSSEQTHLKNRVNAALDQHVPEDHNHNHKPSFIANNLPLFGHHDHKNMSFRQ